MFFSLLFLYTFIIIFFLFFLSLQVDNIAQFIVQTRFVCQFNIEGKTILSQK